MPNVSPAPHGCHSSTVSMGTESPHTAGGNHRAVGAQQPQLFGILSIPTQKTQKAPPLLLPSVPPIKTAMCGVRKAVEGPAHLPCEPTLTHCSLSRSRRKQHENHSLQHRQLENIRSFPVSRPGGQQFGAGELRVRDLHSNSSRFIHPNWKGLQRMPLIYLAAALAGF